MVCFRPFGAWWILGRPFPGAYAPRLYAFAPSGLFLVNSQDGPAAAARGDRGRGEVVRVSLAIFPFVKRDLVGVELSPQQHRNREGCTLEKVDGVRAVLTCKRTDVLREGENQGASFRRKNQSV